MLVNTKSSTILLCCFFFLSHKQCQTFPLSCCAFRVIKTNEKLISSTMKCYKWIERFMQDSELFSHYVNGMVRVLFSLLDVPIKYAADISISCCEASCFIFLQTVCLIHTHTQGERDRERVHWFLKLKQHQFFFLAACDIVRSNRSCCSNEFNINWIVNL